MPKQNWEEKFDSEWYLWDYSKKLNTYNTCGEAVKSFINQLLAEQEGEFRKLVKESRPIRANASAILKDELLDDLLKKLDEK